MAKVQLKNKTGVMKKAKVGFSWTTLFFGGWVALFRGQWVEVMKWWLLNPITIGIWGICQCWNANKKHVVSLIEKGYEPATDKDSYILNKKKIINK